MRALRRYRRAQALVVALLSALVTGCLVLAPLHTRAVEQATVRTTLEAAGPDAAGLRLTSSSATEPTLVLSPDDLEEAVPPSIRGDYGPLVASTSVTVRRMPFGAEPAGRLLTRDGMCEHVRFVSGRCPTAAGEVAVTADQARVHRQRLGSRLAVGEFDTAVSTVEASPRTVLRVVGVYVQVDGPYWFGDRLDGPSAEGTGFDTMLTHLETLTGLVTGPTGDPATWLEPHQGADLPLRVDRIGIDRIGPLSDAVESLVRYPLGAERSATLVAGTVAVSSGLPALAREVRTGSEQAGTTVPLLMAQLALLLVCVLWLVLAAAADARRAEVAIARLRGRGFRGSRRLLLAETIPPILVGVPFGAGLAVGLTTIARHSLLTGEPPLEIPAAAPIALVLGLALMTGLAVLSVRRVCRDPVDSLVRSVAPRREHLRLGVLEAMLVAVSVGAFVALVTGSVQGPVGQVAPTLLAVALGLLGTRLLGAGLAATGRLLLRRGRPAAGTALLATTRRGATRWLVPVVTVALSVVVFGADVLAVAERNWAGRADAEVGARTVLTLGTNDLPTAVEALRSVDPDGAQVTPVVVVQPSVQGGATTVGVVPEAFRRVALWPGVASDTLAWPALTPPTAPPLPLTGRRVTFHLRSEGFTVVEPASRPAPTALVLALRIVRADGGIADVPLATIGPDPTDDDRDATVDCAAGCRVAGIGVLAPTSAAAVNGRLNVSGLTVDGATVDLARPGDWRDTTDLAGVSGTVEGSGLTVDYANNGEVEAFLAHASTPGVVPALTSPGATPASVSASFAGALADGTTLLLRSAGRLPYVPGAPAGSAVVDLDNLLAERWRSRGSATMLAFADTRDPAFLARVTDALDTRGIRVLQTRHPETPAAAYRASAAAWSLRLALAVAVLSLVVAAAGILVISTTSSRQRARDHAALRLVGERPRAIALLAQLETLPVILAAAALGAAGGLWAAPPSVGRVPLFTTPPPTYPVDLGTAWGPSLLAAVAGALVLLLVGALANLHVVAQSHPSRLRETL